MSHLSCFLLELTDEFNRVDNFDKIVTFLLIIMAVLLELGSLMESILSKRFMVQIGIREGKMWRGLEGFIVRLPGRRIMARDTNPTLKIGQFSLLPFCCNDSKQNAPFKWFLGYFDLKQSGITLTTLAVSPLKTFMIIGLMRKADS